METNVTGIISFLIFLSIIGAIGNILIIFVYIKVSLRKRRTMQLHGFVTKSLTREINQGFLGHMALKENKLRIKSIHRDSIAYRNNHAIPKFLILLQTFVDLFITICILPMKTFNYFYHTRLVCVIQKAVLEMAISLSSTLTLLIAMDRYFAICHPMNRMLSLRKIHVLTLLLVAISVTFGLAYIIAVSVKHPTRCSYYFDGFEGYYVIIVLHALFIMTGCVTVVIFYSRIWLVVFILGNKNAKSTNNNNNNGSTVRATCRRSKFDQKLNIVKNIKTGFVLFLSSVIFLISFIPYILGRLQEPYQTDMNIMTDDDSLLKNFYLINYVINPLLYIVVSKNTRHKMKNYLFSRGIHENVIDVASSRRKSRMEVKNRHILNLQEEIFSNLEPM